MIPLYKVHMPKAAGEYSQDVLFSGQLARGKYVDEFEAGLRSYIGNPNICATGDIATSLLLALYMSGVRPGDTILASPMACLATNMPVLNLFAKLRWVDTDPATGNISVESIKEKLTPDVKAVLLYHWAGNPVDLDPVLELASEKGVAVIDDAGEAMGAEYKGRKIGNCGCDYTVFSFHAIRHITTIEGGAIAYKTERDFVEQTPMRRFGIDQKSFRLPDGEINPDSDIPHAGFNTYLSHVNAAVGVAQIPELPGIVSKHQSNGEFFDIELQNIPGIQTLQRPENSKSAYWVYTFRAERRDQLLSKLKEKGVGASRVHLRNDIYSCFSEANGESLPGLDAFAADQISIPCGWWVSEADREKILSILGEGW